MGKKSSSGYFLLAASIFEIIMQALHVIKFLPFWAAFFFFFWGGVQILEDTAGN